MEHEKPTGSREQQEFVSGENQQRHSEENSIESLPEKLGFIETSEMAEVRVQLIEAILAGSENVQEKAAKYHVLAEEVIDQYKGDDFARVQIGLMAQMANIKYEAGLYEDYNQDIEDIKIYMENMKKGN